MGTALSVAAARAFEFRRTTEQRLTLIRKLVEIGGASAHHRFNIPSKRFIGNVVDATYLDYLRDRRVGRLPFHALSNVEKEVYEARAQIMDYLAECVRDAYYEIRELMDKDSSRDATGGRKSRTVLTRSQTSLLTHPSNSTRSRTISSLKLGLPARNTTQSNYQCTSTQTVLPHSPATESSSNSKKDIFYSFCYECGRSAGVRLVPCSRCRLVYYCSKACKLKSWTVRHRMECFVVPVLACPTSKETTKQTGGLSKHPDTSERLDQSPEKHAKHRQNFVYEDGLELGRFLLCRSAGGELLGTWHPAYQYRFILNRYLRVNQRGRIFISKYDGCGNYSLI
ncbi:hypothetical protein PHET_09902 [Paragonimus heterotremus]|uniref:MYND-type domain-containing protein n=1 Tax=Paragonimus heterotremus TaxID=100268 RepID=A0A8J4TAM0_9TREM|nr:hypothetical protein PHET_09902 [Paragonimus heterotremus]